MCCTLLHLPERKPDCLCMCTTSNWCNKSNNIDNDFDYQNTSISTKKSQKKNPKINEQTQMKRDTWMYWCAILVTPRMEAYQALFKLFSSLSLSLCTLLNTINWFQRRALNRVQECVELVCLLYNLPTEIRQSHLLKRQLFPKEIGHKHNFPRIF